jgi:hypothetical protein
MVMSISEKLQSVGYQSMETTDILNFKIVIIIANRSAYWHSLKGIKAAAKN